jgi:hypothetical protein
MIRIENSKKIRHHWYLWLGWLSFVLACYSLWDREWERGLMFLIHSVAFFGFHRDLRKRRIKEVVIGGESIDLIRGGDRSSSIPIHSLEECRMNDFCAELRYREDGKLRTCLIRDSEFDDQAWRRLHAELKKLPLP